MNPRSSSPSNEGDSPRIALTAAVSFGRFAARNRGLIVRHGAPPRR
jgi:hypothetical protein